MNLLLLPNTYLKNSVLQYYKQIDDSKEEPILFNINNPDDENIISQIIKNNQEIAMELQTLKELLHDIKTPLTVIDLSAEGIKKLVNKSKLEQKEILLKKAELIINNIEKSRSIIKEGILDHNNLVFDKFNNLKTIIKKIKEEHLGIYPKIQIKIDINSLYTSSILEIDYYRLFNNLLINSLEANNFNEIKVAIEALFNESTSQMIIYYSDNGIGLNGSKDKIQCLENINAGLGTHILQTIMDKYQGSIELCKNRLDKGISFKLTFPAKYFK